MELTFQGIRSVDREATRYRAINIDYREIEADGVALSANEFAPDSNELPDGWEAVGRDADELKVLRDEAGTPFVRTWYQAALRTRLSGLKNGEPFTLSFEARRSPAAE